MRCAFSDYHFTRSLVNSLTSLFTHFICSSLHILRCANHDLTPQKNNLWIEWPLYKFLLSEYFMCDFSTHLHSTLFGLSRVILSVKVLFYLSLSFARTCVLTILARTTPLVEAVLQTNFISVYVLPDTKVRGAKQVNKKSLISFKWDLQFSYWEAFKSNTNYINMCLLHHHF